MRETRHILLIALIACSLSAFGQTSLQFGSTEWNFGSIREESGPIAHSFEATNRSEHPEVILDVSSTCGCTKPEFSRRPVRPGETTTVTVRFNPAGQSGTIDRTLVVYGSGNQTIGRLRITGRVEPRARTIEERFPVAAGDGVRLSNNYLPFETLPHGRETGADIGIANESDSPRQIRFVGERTSGLLAIEAPEVLLPGEEATVRIVYRIPEGYGRYGTVNDRYTLEVDGRRQSVRITTRGILVDAPQPAGTAAPAARLSSGAVSTGDLKRMGGRQQVPVSLRNEGGSTLRVRAVEIPEGTTCTLEAGTQIAPGGSVPFEVGIDPSERDFGVASERILIVTDDPKHPVLRLRITANIID